MVRAGWARGRRSPGSRTEVLAVDHLPDAAPPPYAVGQALVRRPRAQGMLDLTWTAARASAFISANGRDAVLDLEPNYAHVGSSRTPDSSSSTAGGSVRVTPLVEFYVRATNLFDRAYEEALGFPALGRAVQVGVRVAGGR